MKNILYILLLITPLFFTNNTFSQSNKEKVSTFLKEIYGDYYSDLIENSSSQIDFYTKIYERCEIINNDQAPQNIDNISELDVMDKYNPEVIQHENGTEINPKTFNVLKYRFAYYHDKDLYFRIYQSDYVLKVNKHKN